MKKTMMKIIKKIKLRIENKYMKNILIAQVIKKIKSIIKNQSGKKT